jgi:hypothetical protein
VDIEGDSAVESLIEFQTNISILYTPDFLGIHD